MTGLRGWSATALLLVALIAWVGPGDLPRIAPGEAAAHEGQRVLVYGAVDDVRVDGDRARFDLIAEGYRIRVFAPASMAPVSSWVEAAGTVERLESDLVLFATTLHEAAPDDPVEPAWRFVAARPSAWVDQSLLLHGTVEGSWFVGDHASVRIGDGSWPPSGPVRAVGRLAYDADCFCFKFHADAVRPWTWA